MSWLWTLLSGLVTIAVVLWASFRISNRRILRLCRALPSAQPCHPVLGNALSFACSMEKLTQNLLKIVDDAVDKGHRAVCCWVGAYPLILVTDPDDIKKISNSSISRGSEMEVSSRIYMKRGLITAPVEHWKVTRPRLNLMFQSRNLEQLMASFNRNSRRLVNDLSGHLDGAATNVMPYVIRSAIKSIGFYLYGVDDSEYYDKDIQHGIEIASELMALRIIFPWLRNDLVFQLLYGKEIKIAKTACIRIAQIANEVSLVRNLSNEDESTNADSEEFDRVHTVLDVMRDLQKRFLSISSEDVIDEMISFFAAGTDTVGTTVSSCLLALASFPQIQNKLYDEICSVASEDGDITHVDLRRLPYLDQVIKETLRFFTVVPITTRVPRKDIDLGGYILPANKTVYLCISVGAIDHKHFPDPHMFDPDRFSSENRSAEGVFMPFGRGPRNCIGKEYAMILTKVMVAHVVRSCVLSTTMDIHALKKKYMMTINSCDGYNIVLKRRSNLRNEFIKQNTPVATSECR